MKSIPVTASTRYVVKIGAGLLSQSGKQIADAVGVCKACIVSDDVVAPLYAATVRRSLRRKGFTVVQFTFPHGESSKSLNVYDRLLRFLSEHQFSRSDLLIALGGGVTGDLTGFAASTYQRGIKFVQMPTTLLAAVDSSVGGKTAVNLPTGKNQVGTFYQPALVLCDTNVFATLPEEEFQCGYAEVIKYGVLGNEPFFRSIEETHIKDQLEDVITACVEMKRDVVCEDEFDVGLRQLLNFGHTIGHGIEACSGFTILHGQAVSAGMAIITRACAAKGICSRATLNNLLNILQQYELPIGTIYSARELYKAMLTDKKISGKKINLVIPESIGLCRLQPILAEDLIDWLHAGGVK